MSESEELDRDTAVVGGFQTFTTDTPLWKRPRSLWDVLGWKFLLPCLLRALLPPLRYWTGGKGAGAGRCAGGKAPRRLPRGPQCRLRAGHLGVLRPAWAAACFSGQDKSGRCLKVRVSTPRASPSGPLGVGVLLRPRVAGVGRPVYPPWTQRFWVPAIPCPGREARGSAAGGARRADRQCLLQVLVGPGVLSSGKGEERPPSRDLAEQDPGREGVDGEGPTARGRWGANAPQAAPHSVYTGRVTGGICSGRNPSSGNRSPVIPTAHQVDVCPWSGDVTSVGNSTFCHRWTGRSNSWD